MTFREDGEGLNDRADRLDHDLLAAQKTLNEARERRLQHLEYELSDAQDRLQRMQASLRQLRGDDVAPPSSPPPAASPRAGSLAGLARALPVLLPVGMVAMLGFAIGHSSARKHRHHVPTLSKTTTSYGAVTSAKMTGSASTRTSPAASDSHTASIHVKWPARVRKATGLALPVGSSCTIEGDFTSRGQHLRTANVRVRCGDKLVYEKGNYSGATPQVSVDEYTVEGGSFVYNLDLEDDSRHVYDKRSMATIDTDARTAVLYRDTGDTFRVELDVDPVAAPTASTGSLFNTTRSASQAPSTRLLKHAHVVSTSGSAAVLNGQKCTVEIVPATARSGWSCRTFVRCGDKPLYGEQRTGYSDCSGPDDKLEAHDHGFTMEDGDPKLDIDLAKGTVHVFEEDTQTWSATLKID